MADGAAQFCGVIEVDRIDGANGAGANVSGRNADLQAGQRKDGKFGAGVAAVEVFARVRFGIAAGLRFFESLAEGNARGFDAAKDVVASAVQNAGNAVESISAKSSSQCGENGNAACHGRSKLKLATVRTRKLQQVRAMTGDELLVGRHHGLASIQRASHQLFRWRQSPDQLYNNVGVGVENRVEVFSPNYVARYPGLLLALEVPIADVRQAEQAVATLAENLGHGAAHGSKAHQRNPARGSAIPGKGIGISVQCLLWRSLVQCLISRMKLIFIIRGICRLREVESKERSADGRPPSHNLTTPFQ